MKILNILFEDRYGGPHKRVIGVAAALRAEGIETVLCLPEGSGNAPLEAEKAGVRSVRIGFHRIPRPSQITRLLGWLFSLPRDVGYFRELYGKERPDCVHVNGAFFLPPAIACRKEGVPLVWHLNDVIMPSYAVWFFSWLVKRMADCIVVSSIGVARHYHVDDFEVVYPPLIVGKSVAHGARSASAKPRIGIVANWSPIKGIEYFVQACDLLKQHLGDAFQMVFVGEKFQTHKEYCDSVESLIDECGLRPLAEDHGFVSDVSLVIAGLDVLVMSSTSESFSMVVLEAMSLGVPVVASDVGGVSEAVFDGEDKAGIIVPPADPAAIAAAVSRILEDADMRQRFGESGIRMAKQRFSLEQCARTHKRVYTKVIED